MKIRLLFIVTLLAGIVSACGEKDIAVFEGRNQIYFEKFYMYNPQIEMFAHFKTKSSFHKTKRII